MFYIVLLVVFCTSWYCFDRKLDFTWNLSLTNRDTPWAIGLFYVFQTISKWFRNSVYQFSVLPFLCFCPYKEFLTIRLDSHASRPISFFVHHELSLNLLGKQFMILHSSVEMTVCWIQQICCYCDTAPLLFKWLFEAQVLMYVTLFPLPTSFPDRANKYHCQCIPQKAVSLLWYESSFIDCWSGSQ